MTEFTQVHQVPHIVVDDGAASTIGSLLRGHFKGTSVLVVTDAQLLSLGLAVPLLSSLKAAGWDVVVYDNVSTDPPDHQVIAAAKLAADADVVVGFGGGSVMDVAKVAAVLSLGEQQLDDIYGVGNVKSGRKPLLQVPTTAGTGSEVTNVSILTTGATTKMGIVDPALYADIAVLDATLTTGLPRTATASTGIDAMVHAIEAFTSKRLKNPISDGLAIQALKMLSGALLRACEQGGDITARRDMLVGAMLAGQAFSNAPVAAVHALAYPLGGHFHIAHGLSNALVLPHVLKFNASEAAPLYADLAEAMGHSGTSREAKSDAFIDWLETMAVESGIVRRLRDVGIGEDAVPMLAREAMKQERLLINNPRPVSEGEARALYEAAW